MPHILIIDDDDLVLEQIQEWFLMEGYEVVALTNPVEGVETALNQPPDLVVCDVAMPEMSGYDVLLELRKHAQTMATPFIFLTAQSDKQFMRHGMELGADDYLTKPFTRAEVLAAVRTRLARRDDLVEALGQPQLDEVKTNLARMVAHELKTPLVNIALVKDIIERQLGRLSQAELAELINTLGAGTERLTHLVEQMVYMTQLDTGVLTPEAVKRSGIPVEIWQIMPGAVDVGRRYAFRNKQIPVVTDLRDQHAAVQAHMQALKHALAEIICNALNYSHEDGQVIISQWQSDDAIWITIADQGIGMTPEQQAQALHPFEQIDRGAQEQQGMGMGLPIVRRIVEAHGGHIELQSVEGRGTQVSVRLPALS